MENFDDLKIKVYNEIVDFLENADILSKADAQWFAIGYLKAFTRYAFLEGQYNFWEKEDIANFYQDIFSELIRNEVI